MTSSISADKQAELLYAEWQHRHSVYWKTLHLWGALVILTLVAPFTVPHLRSLGALLYLFPVVAVYLATLGGWHLACEHERLKAVSKAYGEHRGGHPKWQFEAGSGSLYERAVSVEAAKILARLFFWGLGAASISTALAIWYLLEPEIGLVGHFRLPLGTLLPGIAIGICMRDVMRKKKPNSKLDTAKAD